MKANYEIACKYRAGVICVGKGDYVPQTQNCDKCGFCPAVEQKRKENLRVRRGNDEQ